ncbi:hypothetical protein HFC70_23565 [Agrobacterium sp. a22-2]|uniref:hypothetical protein n=1 Tax=Agrobacterium sp. a22-2 TaxID=2283840 RepID=UPI001445CF9F|nr:hypothetical protein [Agrobacterium sp. a22-2]NKN39327.1 hypothetical protein [Agrobacterium sp. a22-2]
MIESGKKLEEWRHLIEQPKSIFAWPSWKTQKVVRENTAKAKAAERQPFYSVAAERIELLIQLMDENDISIEIVRIRLQAWTQRPMEDITATFEVLHQDRWVCISRIDFAPSAPHTNVNWRKFRLSPEVNGSHIHLYEDNAKLGDEAFKPSANLPNASPLQAEPQSFRDVAKEIEQHFHISGLSELPPPDWSGRLL